MCCARTEHAELVYRAPLVIVRALLCAPLTLRARQAHLSPARLAHIPCRAPVFCQLVFAYVTRN